MIVVVGMASSKQTILSEIDRPVQYIEVEKLAQEQVSAAMIIVAQNEAVAQVIRTTVELTRAQALFIVLDELTSSHHYSCEEVLHYEDYLTLPIQQQQWDVRVCQWKRWQQCQTQAQTTHIQLQTLLNNIPYMAWFKDEQSHYLKANEAFQFHSGKTPSQIAGSDDLYVWDGQIGEKCREYDLQVMNERRRIAFQEIIPGRRGRRHFHVYKSPVIDEHDQVIGTIGIADDITETLNEQSKMFALIDNLPFAVCVRDLVGRIININTNYQQYVDAPMAIGDSVYDERFISKIDDRELIQAQDVAVIQQKKGMTYRKMVVRNDREQYFEINKTPLIDIEGSVYGIIVIIRDVTEQVEHEDAIKKLAYADSLTGLANRSGLYLHLQEEYQQAKMATLFFLDLDNFKQLNDEYGHKVGNSLLREVAKRLRAYFPDAFITRDGGDEFTVLTTQPIADAQQHAQQLVTFLAQPCKVSGLTQQIQASIGIVTTTLSHRNIDEVIVQGETALHAAKKSGAQQVVAYTPALDAEQKRALKLLGDFAEAIQKEEIYLFYQPQYTCQHELVGFEALFRWPTQAYHDLNVAQMIEIIEATPLVHVLGEYVMHKAMVFAKQVNEKRQKPLSIAINVSAHQVMADNFIETVQALIDKVGVHPTWICLEITETVLLKQIETNILKLTALRALGIQIALDDFGTGYSSLNYLVKLPLSKVKIDRSFVRELTTSAQYRTLVEMIIQAAHAMDLPVVAEGVETEAELAIMAQLAVDEIQGYYFSRPLPEAEALLK